MSGLKAERIDFIRNEVYKLKLLRLSERLRIDTKIFSVTELYESFYILLKYIDIETIARSLKENKFIINEYKKDVGIEFILLNSSCKGAIWCNSKYSGIFDFNKNIKYNEFEFRNVDIIPNYMEYNKINYIEAVNIIIEGKLYEPIKQIAFGEYESIIILTMNFNYKNEIKVLRKEYKVYTFKSITEVDFYLMCNLDIILNFEDTVVEKVEKYSWNIINNEERNYANNFLRKKILEKLKTIRQCVREFEKAYRKFRD